MRKTIVAIAILLLAGVLSTHEAHAEAFGSRTLWEVTARGVNLGAPPYNILHEAAD